MLLVAALAMCAMTLTTFFACGDGETTYLKNYTYEVKEYSLRPLVRYGYADDAKKIQNAFNAVANSKTFYSSPKDEEIKKACESIHNQYKDNIESAYLLYKLIRTTHDATPGVDDVDEVVAIYEFGQSLTKPFVLYSFTTNQDEAYAAMDAKESSLSEDDFRIAYRRLRSLIGIYAIAGEVTEKGFSFAGSSYTSYFDTYFLRKKLGFAPAAEPITYPESADDERYFSAICDSIADAHANDSLAVEAVVTLNKINLRDWTDVKKVWSRTFPANF